jgi:hypothetical protein
VPTEQAKAELPRQQEWDVDAVKVYDGLSEEQYLATVAEAKNRGMYVVGHILNQMPLDEQLESGIDEIAHIDEFLSQQWRVGVNQTVAWTYKTPTADVLESAGRFGHLLGTTSGPWWSRNP